MQLKKFSFTATESSGTVSAILMKPQKATSLLVLAHGAGAGMNHPFMEKVSNYLADKGIATFRFNFPYMEKGKRTPDVPPVAIKTICSAVETAMKHSDGLPLFAGGKSFGGRMTSQAAAQKLLPQIKGLVYFGFPLHAMGKPSMDRAEHLQNIAQPMLFLQGTKDKLAEISLVEKLCSSLGKKATLHVVENADHSFHVPKGNDDAVLKDLCQKSFEWISSIITKAK